MTRSRRSFIASLTSIGIGSPFVGRFLAAEETLSGRLLFLRDRGGAALPPTNLREQYLLDPGVTYLNHASIGTMPAAVHEARLEYSAICESNPHLYIWGGAWDTLLDEVRAKGARLLGVPPEHVSITHNTTEGFNTLAQGLPLEPGDEVLFSSLNHGGASIPFQHWGDARGYSARRFDFPVERIPELSEDEVVELHLREIRPETRVLVFPHVDNIVGLRHPATRLARAAKDAGVEFVAVDGAQAVGSIEVDLAGSTVDAYSTSPHKWLQTPKGLGMLYVSADLRSRVRPMWVRYGTGSTGEGPRRYEDYGTRNAPEVMSLGDAMDFQDALGADEKQVRYRRLRSGMRERTDAVRGLSWNSPPEFERGSVLVSIGFSAPDAAARADQLYREDGIVVRPFQLGGRSAFRVSPNTMTTESELDRLFERLEVWA